jgi:hypothetical protein
MRLPKERGKLAPQTNLEHGQRIRSMFDHRSAAPHVRVPQIKAGKPKDRS